MMATQLPDGVPEGTWGGDWAGEARTRGCAALAAAVLLVLTVAVLFLPLAVIGMVFLLADLGIIAMAAGRLLRGRGGVFLIAAAVPAWTLMGVEVARLTDWHPYAMVTCGMAGAALGIVAFPLAADRWLPLAAAGATAMPPALLATGLLALGLEPVRAAGVLAALLAAAVGLAPRVVRAWSPRVGPAAVNPAVLAGGLGALAAVAVVTAGALLTGDSGWGVALALALAAIFALGSRAFTRTAQVLPLLLFAVLTTAAGLFAGPRAMGASGAVATWVTFAGALGLVGLLLVAARPRLGEAGSARLRQVLAVAHLVALVGLMSLATVVVGGLEWERT